MIIGSAAAAEPIADAVVVAAGTSSRMGGVDKLMAPIAGRPLLAWTLAALDASPEVARIVVVGPEERAAALRAGGWLPASVVGFVGGGSRRQESVAAGIAALDDAGPEVRSDRTSVVLVHDGARPLVSPRLIGAIARAAAEHGAAIPVVPVPETLKRVVDGRVAGTVDRDGLAAAQTPQGIRRDVLREVLRRLDPAGPDTWTDEAAMLEACRIPVHALPGEPSNLKVTLPADLVRAEQALLVSRGTRIGFGHDTHPFGPGEPLALGGLAFAGVPRLHGHSDGDVALHAVADALLGAASLGDLGRLFPAGDATPRGIASTELVREVVRRVREAGHRPVSVDLTITGARPRLAARLPEMRAAIAALLDMPEDAVSVKASTANLAGMEGAGRGISADAIAVVEAAR